MPAASPQPLRHDARLPALVGQAMQSDDALMALSAANPDLRIERSPQGSIVIMAPTGSQTGKLNFDIAVDFGIWVRVNGDGVGFDSSTGFKLPNGAVRSADLAWVQKSRWEALTTAERSGFAPLCPDFVLELRSPSDELDDLKEKLEEFRANGARLGWLIDPIGRALHVYRPGLQPEVLSGAPASVSGDPELPRFVLDLSRIWI